MASLRRRPRLAFATAAPLNLAQNARRCTCFPRALRASTLHGAALRAGAHTRARASGPTITMVFGGGGILGVGAPEVFVIVAVGWFVLGPKQLLSLSRDIGKIIGDIRKATSEAQSTFTDAIETDLAVMEARKIATPVEGPALPDQERPVLETDEELLAKNDVIQAAAEREQPLSSTRAGDKFMDQLKRVADPDQTSVLTPNVPDLALSEVDEIAMLEERLRLAKERLENKGTPSSSLNGTQKDDGAA